MTYTEAEIEIAALILARKWYLSSKDAARGFVEKIILSWIANSSLPLPTSDIADIESALKQAKETTNAPK